MTKKKKQNIRKRAEGILHTYRAWDSQKLESFRFRAYRYLLKYD
jgi:hypothetical protein